MTLLGARGDGPNSVSARQPGDSRVGSAEDHRHCAGPLIKLIVMTRSVLCYVGTQQDAGDAHPLPSNCVLYLSPSTLPVRLEMYMRSEEHGSRFAGELPELYAIHVR